MAERPLRLLQVSAVDADGGAERVAWNLFQEFQERDYAAWLAVGKRLTCAPNVLAIPNDAYRNSWFRWCKSFGDLLLPLVGKIRGAGRIRSLLLYSIGQPQRWLETRRGHEDFDCPGSWRLLDLPPERPDILHCHNLHGGYFDLRALPSLSKRLPVVLTLHDAWMLSGHCAHSFDCERWKTGCGQCPDLKSLPSLQKDGTAYNWQRKQQIYSDSRLYVSTPSQWLMEKVRQSILKDAIVEARVIPYGIDLSIFRQGNKSEARAKLGLPQDVKIILFTSNRVRNNPFKDYQTMQSAVSLAARQMSNQKLLFLALGEEGPSEQLGQAEVRFIPFKKEPQAVSLFYQAADLYIHAAHADTFPNTILESLACGTPVIATAVGGIPEQVKGLRYYGSGTCHLNKFGPNEATGILVPPKDAKEMSAGIEQLLNDAHLRQRIGANAAKDAQERFDLQRQINDYLCWYQQIIDG